MAALKVFFSYAHEDRELCEDLKRYLIPLKRAGVISDWYDRDIPAGKEWQKEIDHHLGDADLILLLVSADFMASEYCWGIEVARAMERHDRGEARVVPVILRPSDWQDAPFQKLQCLPTEALPVTAWQDRDEALLDVARGIRGAAGELRQIEARRQEEEKRKAEAQQRAEEERAEEVRRQQEQLLAEATPQERSTQPALPGGEPSGRGSHLLWGGLVIVILVGVGGYYYWITAKEPPHLVVPVALEMKIQQEPKPSPVQEPTVAPAAQDIHGWSADKVQDLQERTAQALAKAVKFRDPLKDGGQGPEMVVIPAGEFLMGSPETEEGRDDDESLHRVVIEKPFAMGKYAVTFDEYDRFAKATKRELPDDEKWGRDRRPVINVSWFDAVAYAEWLSEQTGEEYRLPTEAEWEYAARAGTTTPFWFGESISTEQANYNGNYAFGDGAKGTYRKQTVPVDGFEANPWGLFDVHGNVWEWTCSGYNESYNGTENRCISNNDPNSSRVQRGGSWGADLRGLRSANRGWVEPEDGGSFRGFRLARSFSL